MKTEKRTTQLTILGLMTALMMLFSFTPIGSIPIGPLVISLNVIPVAISAVTLGPRGGALAGGVFGILSFLQCFGIGVPSAMGAVLADIDPALAFIQRFIPRLLDGFLAGLVFQRARRNFRPYISCGITGFCTAFFNTVLFMTALVVLFGNTEYVRGLVGGRNILVFICAFVGVNAVVEMIVATVVTAAVGTAFYKAQIIQEMQR